MKVEIYGVHKPGEEDTPTPVAFQPLRMEGHEDHVTIVDVPADWELDIDKTLLVRIFDGKRESLEAKDVFHFAKLGMNGFSIEW